LSAWVRALDQYKGGKGADRQFYLSAWSGSPVMVDRKARKEPLMIPRPFLVLTGAIQPLVLSELRNYREDSLLDRFLFAYPDPVPSRWTDDEISGETFARYHELYDRLYDLAMGVDANGDLTPESVQLTVGAKALFVREADALREEMERPGFPDHLKGPWSKLEAYLARLSLILALVRIAEEDFLTISTEEMTEGDVRSAADLVSYFRAHARRVYTKLHGERPEYLLAEALKAFLTEQGGHWEGQTSELYEILKARSTPGLPAGEGAFGRRLRKTTAQSSGFVLEELWRGNVQVVRLTLVTPGTPGDLGATGGTGGKTTFFRTPGKVSSYLKASGWANSRGPVNGLRSWCMPTRCLP
jgi:hypothetical protein